MSGGKLDSKDVMNYSAPKGPKGIDDPAGPGLHGVNRGITNGPKDANVGQGGKPGLGGNNYGNCGTQGRY